MNDKTPTTRIQPVVSLFDEAETHRLRQWFDAVQDLNPAHLERDDYILAKRIYCRLGMRVPDSVVKGAETHG